MGEHNAVCKSIPYILNLHGGNKIIPQTGIIEIPTKTHLNM